MKKFSLIFLFLIFNTAFANIWDSKCTLETISKQLPPINSIKCKFKQEKIIPNIEKPLISSGNFEFIENDGIYFYTTSPFKSNTNYTNKNYKQINDIINAINSKKFAKLEKEFDFYFEKNEINWTFGLKPKNGQKSSEFLSSIMIEGKDIIQKIIIKMTDGTITTLWFEK